MLTALNLPVKRPFKKMFMSDEDKKIYSMVQRLSHIDKAATKEKRAQFEQKQKMAAKRLDKVQAKRDEHNKQNRIDRYKKAQGGRNFGGHKNGGKKN